jgi:glucosyl-3-phosphoglycerate synthase
MNSFSSFNLGSRTMLATFDHAQFDPQSLLRRKREPVTVCIPTRETADTIGETVGAIAPLQELGLVDQLLVIDADSEDGTASLAQAAGADVYLETDLLPQFGPVLGKGDAMWRALSVATGEIVVYLDGDVRDFDAHYVTGLLGPLVESERIAWVKGFYRRPLAIDGLEIEDGGGRVTELTARPLLELLVPDLAAFRQPLAGECAARRSLLMEIPYCCGYGVEIAMLLEAWRRLGLSRMAQVGLGSKRNSHQSLASLAEMSREVIEALVTQIAIDGDDQAAGSITPAEGWEAQLSRRPPMESLAMDRTPIGETSAS